MTPYIFLKPTYNKPIANIKILLTIIVLFIRICYNYVHQVRISRLGNDNTILMQFIILS